MKFFSRLQKNTKKGFLFKCRKPVLLFVITMLVVTLASCAQANHISDTPTAAAVTTTPAVPSQPAVMSDERTTSEETLLPAASPDVISSPDQTEAPVTEYSPLINKITVTFCGDASTAKGFTWYTNRDSQSSDVQVAPKTSQRPDFSQSRIYTGTVADSHNSPDELVHKASAVGLASNTAYYYRVGDARLNIWSDPAVFTTAPESGSFTFVDLSDTQFANQAGANVTADTISKALSQVGNAGFIIHNGDVVDNKSEEQWNLLLQTAKSSLMNTTIMPASGNHDAGNSTFIDHFNFDTPGQSSTGAYYSVNYSNAHFVVLNTNESSDRYKEFTNAQLDWLKADIGSAKSAGAQWIIVVMHMGPYTTAEHSADSNIKDTRAKIAPLLSELGVDLVLQGHDHVYERSKPIADGIAAKEAIVTDAFNGSSVNYILNPKGTVYLTPGTAGTKHYYQNSGLSQSYLALFNVADGPYKGDPDLNNQETFIAITIDGSKLTAIAYQLSKTINSGKPYIFDQFGIMKKS
ncbi:metallophosphoesterase family protein [Bacillaceae bacterium Marseille-Q3522]|nr:metallophosphoesterase family protein [Bacillaceae bacterium Marseille-Q3522]